MFTNKSNVVFMAKQKAEKVIAFRAPQDLVNAINRQARREQRKRSNMLMVLVRRGLTNEPPNQGKVDG